MRQMDITKGMRTTKHLLKENWQKEVALIEQRRNAEGVSRFAEFGGHVGTEQETSEESQREEARVEIEEMRGEMTKDGQMIQQEAPNEAELDWEVSYLQPGERRRGISASQSTIGCCLNSTILQQFVTKGAAQA